MGLVQIRVTFCEYLVFSQTPNRGHWHRGLWVFRETTNKTLWQGSIKIKTPWPTHIMLGCCHRRHPPSAEAPTGQPSSSARGLVTHCRLLSLLHHRLRVSHTNKRPWNRNPKHQNTSCSMHHVLPTPACLRCQTCRAGLRERRFICRQDLGKTVDFIRASGLQIWLHDRRLDRRRRRKKRSRRRRTKRRNMSRGWHYRLVNEWFVNKVWRKRKHWYGLGSDLFCREKLVSRLFKINLHSLSLSASLPVCVF